MANLVKAVETTKEYVKRFNARDLMGLAGMLDAQEVVFARQTQPTIIGKQQIMNRTHKMFKRLSSQGQSLTMIDAIIDLPDAKAYPCMIGVLDGERFSVCILDVKGNGQIASITILLSADSVGSARPTDKEGYEKALKQVKKADHKELEERAKGLRKKAKKLKRRMEKEGNTPELINKMLRLQQARENLARQLEASA
ncbi:hypothetical protein RYZ26_15520 [Terasakiella sp. A23]|uniref:hypothetical protein n=1 Tax=Terasakiella sp. FCG-A23 TaxID=3080561 RepID=UPI002954AD87|nr:hypothetical protein [Terasakiella sp. A23]MDV7341015.1 hypothetical protein [Terasakiella sp. A23]